MSTNQSYVMLKTIVYFATTTTTMVFIKFQFIWSTWLYRLGPWCLILKMKAFQIYKQLFYKQLLYSKVPQQRLFNNLPSSTLGYMASKSKGHFGRALNHYWFHFVPLLQHHFGPKCPVLISNCTIVGLSLISNKQNIITSAADEWKSNKLFLIITLNKKPFLSIMACVRPFSNLRRCVWVPLTANSYMSLFIASFP